MADTTFDQKPPPDEALALDKLAIIELGLSELKGMDILSEKELAALQTLRQFLELHTVPKSFADACMRRDRLLRASAGMCGVLFALEALRRPELIDGGEAVTWQ